MPADKPETTFHDEEGFAQRIALHERVAYYPYPDDCQVFVPMLNDEVLVGEQVASMVRSVKGNDVKDVVLGRLEDTGMTVFEQPADNGAKPAEDVAIFRVVSPGSGEWPDVAEAVWAIRDVLDTHGIAPAQVAPNHLLVPAANIAACPWGPPDEVDDPNGELALHPPMDEPVNITVIDSGYRAGGPLTGRVMPVASYWADKDKKKWVKEPVPSSLEVDGHNRLGALVGHANFVAGEILRACPAASVTVMSHNSSLVGGDVAPIPVPTEASVARSLWDALNGKSTKIVPDIINVGFAFPTLVNRAGIGSKVAGGPPSWTFQLVLCGLSRSSPVIVAPAGNENSSIRHYPAAFANVIGVGSLTPGGHAKSVFSNFGPWVNCATEGEDVISTFITGWVGGKTEDAEPPGTAHAGTRPNKTFNSGWASWRGTSFAAPKIAAAIANEKVGSTKTPAEAWEAVKAVFSTATPNPIADVGIAMSGLPPVSKPLAVVPSP